MEEIKTNYFRVLTAKIMYDKTLSPIEILLYAEITGLLDASGACFASNKYFADRFNRNESTISTILHKLEKKRYIIINFDKKDNNKRVIFLSEPLLKNQKTSFEKSKDPLLKNQKTYIYNNKRVLIKEHNKEKIYKKEILKNSTIKKNLQAQEQTKNNYSKNWNSSEEKEIKPVDKNSLHTEQIYEKSLQSEFIQDKTSEVNETHAEHFFEYYKQKADLLNQDCGVKKKAITKFQNNFTQEKLSNFTIQELENKIDEYFQYFELCSKTFLNQIITTFNNWLDNECFLEDYATKIKNKRFTQEKSEEQKISILKNIELQKLKKEHNEFMQQKEDEINLLLCEVKKENSEEKKQLMRKEVKDLYCVVQKERKKNNAKWIFNFSIKEFKEKLSQDKIEKFYTQCQNEILKHFEDKNCNDLKNKNIISDLIDYFSINNAEYIQLKTLMSLIFNFNPQGNGVYFDTLKNYCIDVYNKIDYKHFYISTDFYLENKIYKTIKALDELKKDQK